MTTRQMSTLERGLYRAMLKYRKAYHTYATLKASYDEVCKGNKYLEDRKRQVINAATSVDLTK